MQTRKAATDAEVYISSVNAISLDGEIVNVDYTGNRVAAISFGPSKVYLIFGINKITADLNSAIYRARNIAAPLNAKRLNRKTPCAKKATNFQCPTEGKAIPEIASYEKTDDNKIEVTVDMKFYEDNSVLYSALFTLVENTHDETQNIRCLLSLLNF